MDSAIVYIQYLSAMSKSRVKSNWSRQPEVSAGKIPRERVQPAEFCCLDVDPTHSGLLSFIGIKYLT